MDTEQTPTAETGVDVYWRPGCSFCMSMRAALAEAGVEARWHDIWHDADSAAFVRSVAGGNETVPTITIGGQVMVAPRPREVIGRMVEIDPAAVADPRAWPPLRIAQWVSIAVLLVVWYALTRSGQDALAWLVYGGAVASFFAFRRLRARPRRRTNPTSVDR